MNALKRLDNDKFLVINTERFKELNALYHLNDEGFNHGDHHAVASLKTAIEEFYRCYIRVFGAEKAKKFEHKYIVINQDEPYAEEVAEIISRAGRKVKEDDETPPTDCLDAWFLNLKDMVAAHKKWRVEITLEDGHGFKAEYGDGFIDETLF